MSDTFTGITVHAYANLPEPRPTAKKLMENSALMFAMLKRLEWADAGGAYGACAICAGARATNSHEPWCELNQLLTEVGREG